MIRKMAFSDIPEVQQIDKLCFKGNYLRRVEGIEGYMEKSNYASIVYELDNKVVGYNFIHLWGDFAWFGAFGVNPDYQKKGIGKKLLNHTIKFLKEDMKISTIGLQTMPESSYNVGLYMNIGFTPLKLSLGMKKDLTKTYNSPNHSNYKVRNIDISIESNYLILKKAIQLICNNICHGLDLSSELYLIKNKGFGTAFILEHNNEIKGFALCHTKNIRETPTNCLEIKLLCISNDIDYKDGIDSILKECTSYAQQINYKNIFIDCNTYNYDICKHLLSTHNFKIEKNQLILIMGNENYLNEYRGLILCRWSG